MFRKLLIATLALAAITSSAFAETDGTGFETTPCDLSGPIPGSGTVWTVDVDDDDRDFRTIQEAVDAASAGDYILIYPGLYKEQVNVTRDNLRIRGTSRSGVVLDGGSTNPSNGFQYGINVNGRDNVVIENMTAKNYRKSAFFWWHAKGYMGRYLTVYNNPDYGIYAFDSRCGQIDNSYGSGNGDSAFYIGECFPCDATITDSLSEENGLGYSGTNAGGNLILQNSIWRNNGLGIVPNSLDGESNPPQRGALIRNNIVENNNNKLAPGVGLTGQFWGGGIVLAGGVGNQVIGNTVTDHALGGILTAPLPDSNLWIPSGNTIWGNTVSHDAVLYPDSMDLVQNAISGPNNCWSFNTVGNVSPPALQELWSCTLPTTPAGGDPRVEQQLALGFAGLNGRQATPSAEWPVPNATDDPFAFVNMPDDNNDSSFVNDGGVNAWIPTVL